MYFVKIKYTVYYGIFITHSKEFAGNQGEHQNFNPSVLPYKFGLIFMGMKQIYFFKEKSKWLKKN